MRNASEFLTVSELVRDVKKIVESQFGFIVIKGELTNLKSSFSGHTYFTLKDSNAQIRCVLFSRQKASVATSLQEDREYIVWGNLSIYEQRADITVIVSYLLPYGEGQDALRLKILKEKLEKEGLFDDRHKKAFSRPVTHIGVVTAKGGAAIHDIIRVARNRFPSLKITLFPVLVQGGNASATIINGIRELNRQDDIDVIIVGRGGGAKEDLAVFNDEQLARMVIDIEKPVISAVGHEIDRTILDLVASWSVSTPSAAAEFVTENAGYLIEGINNTLDAMKSKLENMVQQLTMRLDRDTVALRSPVSFLREKRLILEKIGMRLEQSLRAVFQVKKEQLADITFILETHNPLAPLNKGYALVWQDNKVVRSGNDLHQGPLILQFKDGKYEVIRSKPVQ